MVHRYHLLSSSDNGGHGGESKGDDVELHLDGWEFVLFGWLRRFDWRWLKVIEEVEVERANIK